MVGSLDKVVEPIVDGIMVVGVYNAQVQDKVCKKLNYGSDLDGNEISKTWK